MKLDIIIRKINLSNFADSTYWGNFEGLLQLPLDDSQFLKLIEYFQAITEYRTLAQDVLTRADGFNFKFFKSSTNPLVAYHMFGLRDYKTQIPLLRDNEIYSNYKTKRDELFAELGWTFDEERVSEIVCEFNEEALEWSNLPASFEEVDEIYNSSKPVNGVTL